MTGFSLGNSLNKLKWLHRAARGRSLAHGLRKADREYDPDGGIHIVAAADRLNGLSRAYRYEIARLASARGNLLSSSQQVASNFLILGQPKDYHRLLASPPEGFAGGYRIGYWVTEFDSPRPDWGFAFEIVHEIWTPSSFSAKAIQQAGNVPVKVVPHAVSVPDVEPMPRARWGVRDDQFLGMAVMDLSSCPARKNPLAHVRAWKLAFGDDPNVHLIMKVKFSNGTAFAREELMREIEGASNITLTEALFSDLRIAAFQRMADVYISLHRSEGYGLNIHEMLEMGKPVVATGWSGNMDFMPLYPRAIAVPYELVPYSDRTRRYQGEGLRWAEADIDAAAAALRKVRAAWEARRERTASETGTIFRLKQAASLSGDVNALHTK